MNQDNQLALTLLAPIPTGTRELDGEWRVAFPDPAQADDDLYTAPGYADDHWKTARLPHLRYATTHRDVIWYRHRFYLDKPPSGERIILRLGGAFYYTQAWLNGFYLGKHQGYFQPFGFDISDTLQAGENVLALRCHFPVEAGAFKRKTALAGIFADWDCKPYPSTYYPNLPAPHEWHVPLGLWQPACLQANGPLLIESFNIFPTLTDPNWETACATSANVRVVLQVRNLIPHPQQANIRLVLAPHNFEGEAVASGTWPITLESQVCDRFELPLNISQPRLWFPWTHGAPRLYRATLILESGSLPPQEFVQTFGIRSVGAQIDADAWIWQLNGRRIFPRGSNYASDFYLDRMTRKQIGHDLLLAREANLDMLRVHAHIAPPEFYRQCDEQGLLVMCDFPQIWTYAFNLPPTEQAAFRHDVLLQATDMVGLLGSHPSIALWSLHNEPPWTPDGSFLGADVHASATNRETDEAAAEQVRALDPTRPVLAASGQYDQHLYHGWYTGHWRDNHSLQPTFPTEFGVQALPNLDSPFWETVNTTWPVDHDDPTWAYAGYQQIFFERPGVGTPVQYPTLAAYIQESQAYQAFYIRYTIDQWRRKKFQPVGGYIHFLFTDCWPAITWSVLDDKRQPKAGYRALAEASRPTHVCVDITGNHRVEGAFRLAYHLGERFTADLYLVNDDYRLQGRAELRWWLKRETGSHLMAWLQGQLAARCTIILPRAEACARLVKTITLPLPHPGKYTFHTRLTQHGRLLDENHYDLCVGSASHQKHTARRVPGFLISRVYEVGSLHATADGFALYFHNPAMPVMVQRLVEVRVDGRVLDPSQLEVIHNGQARRSSTITPEAPLEFSTGERLLFVIHAPLLAPGSHEFEACIELFGLGEIAARWQDHLAT